MKATVVVLATALLVSSPASAQLTDRTCSLLSKLAEKIMERRQDGDTMREVMEMIEPHRDSIPTEYGIARQMIIQAYQQDQWGSQAAKQRATAEFGNDWARQCFQMIEEKKE